MKDLIVLKWKGGEIEINPLGCTMYPKFKIGNRILTPLHSANWKNDKSNKHKKIPGILKNLRGEFPCVPFGINTSVGSLSKDWKNSFSKKPYIINDPHGFAANNVWDLIKLTSKSAEFKIFYPKKDNIDYIMRTIKVNNKNPSKIDCSLKIIVKKDCKLPIGIHPMINIPNEKNKIKIIPGKFKFGLTYPGVMLSGNTLGKINSEYSSINNVEGFIAKKINLSKPPFDGNFEDLFQLCGTDGSIAIENYKDNYKFKYNWNPNHFSSVLIWISNKGRSEYPWNKKHITVGLEPMTSAFGLSPYVSNNKKNPINIRGVPTYLKFFKNFDWNTYYSFSIEEI